MNNIKNVFTIRDLENLSGIKAHTIRIWEKRYNILEPTRSGTNIRLYDISNLQRLLNITLLHDHGYKISKISQYPPENIPALVQQISSSKNAKHHAVSAFKFAMLNFDPAHFHKVYNELLSVKTFSEIFCDVFMPLLEETGLLWQTGTITPAQEHFLSNLIRQKILLNTVTLEQDTKPGDRKVFVLYLPMNEIHELGLLYLNYELLREGHRTIYLGESVSVENLADMKHYFDKITFISYMTVKPERDALADYIKKMTTDVLNSESEFWVIGRLGQYVKPLSQRVKVFTDFKSLLREA